MHTTLAPSTPQSLHLPHVDSGVQEYVVQQLAKKYDIPRLLAVKALTEALHFLRLCAEFPEQRFAPSREVDAAWHELILCTRAYADVCDQLGRFIHHEPDMGDAGPMPTTADTVAFMTERGIRFEKRLWPRKDEETLFSHLPTGTNCNDPGCYHSCGN